MTAKVTANNTTNKNRFVFMVNLEGKVKTALLVKVMKEWARCTYKWNVQNTQLLFRNQLYWEPRTVSKLKLFFFFMYKLVVLYSVPSCTVKTTLRWMRLYFMFFLFRSGLFVIHLFIIYVFCQWVKRAVLAALSIGWEHLQLQRC